MTSCMVQGGISCMHRDLWTPCVCCRRTSHHTPTAVVTSGRPPQCLNVTLPTHIPSWLHHVHRYVLNKVCVCVYTSVDQNSDKPILPPPTLHHVIKCYTHATTPTPVSNTTTHVPNIHVSVAQSFSTLDEYLMICVCISSSN